MPGQREDPDTSASESCNSLANGLVAPCCVTSAATWPGYEIGILGWS